MNLDLVLPFRPSNLELPPGYADLHVNGDVYRICERVAEISPDLFVCPLPAAREPWRFAIGEHCRDGVDRLIFWCRELDDRVIKELARMMAMPLHARLKKCEADEYKFDADEKERELDDLYENVGRPMWTQLEHDGFIQRGVSFPKSGSTGGKGSIRRQQRGRRK